VPRVIAVVEGSTEQAFIQRVLEPHLAPFNVQISARIIGEPGHKGGDVKFLRVINDVTLLLKQEPSTYVTMLVDRYGVQSDWPDLARIRSQTDPALALEFMCRTLQLRVLEELGEDVVGDRFLPYVQHYESEAFLFVSPAVSARVMGAEYRESSLVKVRQLFVTPEHINDSPLTAPSKRIQKLFPGYQKGRGLNAHLPMVCEAVGLASIRNECPLFDAWVGSLEGLGAT